MSSFGHNLFALQMPMAAAFLSDTFYAAKLFPLRNPWPGSYTTLDNLPWRHVMWQGGKRWNMHGFVSTQGFLEDFWSHLKALRFQFGGVGHFFSEGGNSMIYLCLCFPYWFFCFSRFLLLQLLFCSCFLCHSSKFVLPPSAFPSSLQSK